MDTGWCDPGRGCEYMPHGYYAELREVIRLMVITGQAQRGDLLVRNPDGTVSVYFGQHMDEIGNPRDDTQSLDDWNAKVDALIAEMEQYGVPDRSEEV